MKATESIRTSAGEGYLNSLLRRIASYRRLTCSRGIFCRMSTLAPSTGTLHIVATPIGNLGDMTSRAIEVLRSVDCIFAEDTRTFRKLAQHFGIETRCQSYHDHNERVRAQSIVEDLKAGRSFALVSDAGTPTISDPGYHLVRACRESSIPVRAVPGACSLIAALSTTGFEIHAFTFLGFLPIKQGKKRSALEVALAEERTAVFLESPHRIEKLLLLLAELAPEREIAVCRELTKLHEETVVGTATQVRNTLAAKQAFRGEIVVVIRGSQE